jgi:hypothetical protein
MESDEWADLNVSLKQLSKSSSVQKTFPECQAKNSAISKQSINFVGNPSSSSNHTLGVK